jgi:prolyl 4-hydroxylase
MSAQQAITPELRKWVIDQVQAGCKTEDLLTSMQKAGWKEDVAIAALESTLLDFVVTAKAKTDLTAASSVPEPDLTGSPLWLDAGDCNVKVALVMQSPRVVVFEGLLSDEECDAIIFGARERLDRSKTVARQSGGEEINESRTSRGMFYRRAENEVVDRVEKRIARLIRWPVENGEGLQVLHYSPGAEYKPHYDYFDPTEPGTPTILRRGGQRVGTLVMYLNDPERGGGTTFPDVGLVVAPRKGSAVFFSYDKPHPSTKTLHGGAPVEAGEKWVATKWLRQGVFV